MAAAVTGYAPRYRLNTIYEFRIDGTGFNIDTLTPANVTFNLKHRRLQFRVIDFATQPPPSPQTLYVLAFLEKKPPAMTATLDDEEEDFLDSADLIPPLLGIANLTIIVTNPGDTAPTPPPTPPDPGTMIDVNETP